MSPPQDIGRLYRLVFVSASQSLLLGVFKKSLLSVCFLSTP